LLSLTSFLGASPLQPYIIHMLIVAMQNKYLIRTPTPSSKTPINKVFAKLYLNAL
jgi:hypothetical protein